MISKKDLLDAIDCLTVITKTNTDNIAKLEKRVKELEGGKAAAKRGRGRPRKSTK